MTETAPRRRYVSLLLDMTEPAVPPTVSTTVPDEDGPWMRRAGLDPASQAKLARIRRLATLLDSQFRVPGTNRTFGVDALLGLIPGVGGSAGLIGSVILITEAVRVGARFPTVLRMLAVAGLDAALGAVPVVGWVTDFVLKANERNVRTLAIATLDPGRTDAESRRLVVATLIGAVVLVALALVLAIVAVVALFRAIF